MKRHPLLSRCAVIQLLAVIVVAYEATATYAQEPAVPYYTQRRLKAHYAYLIETYATPEESLFFRMLGEANRLNAPDVDELQIFVEEIMLSQKIFEVDPHDSPEQILEATELIMESNSAVISQDRGATQRGVTASFTVGTPTKFIMMESGLDRYRWVIRTAYVKHKGDRHGVARRIWEGRSRIIVEIYRRYDNRELGHYEIRVESEQRMNESHPWKPYTTDLQDALEKEFHLKLRQQLRGTGQ